MTTTSITWNKKALREPGGSLMVELPAVTSERMEELFGRGAGKKLQRKAKYSDSLVVQLKPSNQTYALYMCFGEWRIGSNGTVSTRVGDLLAYLDPTNYSGAASLYDHQAITLAKLINEEIYAKRKAAR